MTTFDLVREKILLRQVDSSVCERLTAELNVPPAVATILAARGLRDFESCRRFFRPDLSHLHDPFLFHDMERAVDRIVDAIRNKERIVIYGDYDVDGVTSTALMVRVLRGLGVTCEYYLPNRLTEGYGVSEGGIRQIAAGGHALVISVDCGITAGDMMALATSLGLDVIVTDHHEPKETLPPAVAILNPKIKGSGYPDTSLAGVGVALKLCQGLAEKTGMGRELWEPLLDLVAVGTAADIVPLTGENRVIARLGFEQLRRSTVTGLNALIAEQGLAGKPISTSQVVFQLAPCINAVGRLGDPKRGVELLLTENAAAAAAYARELKEANIERRSLDSRVADDACAWVTENCSPERDYAIVMGKEDWHVGVIGIVASKLVERFHRPAILFSIGTDGMARGSGRSLRSVHLLEALDKCGHVLEGYGGHAAAAGMTIRRENIDTFRELFNEAVRSMVSREDMVPTVMADAEVSLAALSPRFYRIVKQMEPFGPGNMRPVLLCRGLTNRYEPRVVGSKHLKMAVSAEGVVMDAIGFNLGDRIDEVRGTGAMTLAFSLDENEWNGKTSLQMKVKGIDL